MKNTIGKPVTGADFYPRNREIERIYRGLDANNNIYISAPRRVGKTSILQELQANPKEGYVFIYGDYEDCDTAEEFFEYLYKAILKNSAQMPKAKRLLEKTKQGYRSIFERIKGFEVKGLKMEFGNDEGEWLQRCRSIMAALVSEHERLVLLIDEYPQVIENIIQNEGNAHARKFLHQKRAIRQDPALNGMINFVYTGSIGISNTVSKTGDLKVINDLETIPIGPLTRDEAIKMAWLIVETSQRYIDRTQLEYLVDKIDWHIPFHIKLILKTILEAPANPDLYVTAKDIDEAFEAIFLSHNRPLFDRYFSRLPRAFQGSDLKFVHGLLNMAAAQKQVSIAVLRDLAFQHGCADRYFEIIESLEADGYVVESKEESIIMFRSIILKTWWHRHESRKYS